MGAYRLTRGNFQARFDSLGRLTHLGHPQRIKLQPTVFHLTGDIREGQWSLNAGRDDLHFDIEATQRTLNFAEQTLTLKSQWRGPVGKEGTGEGREVGCGPWFGSPADDALNPLPPLAGARRSTPSTALQAQPLAPSHIPSWRAPLSTSSV